MARPRGILCVDKIGSADRGILCVDKIGSPEIPQDPCWPLCCWPLCCWPLCCSPLIRRDCLPARIRGWAGTATGPHSHVVHISHTPTERAHTDPKKISFGKNFRAARPSTKKYIRNIFSIFEKSALRAPISFEIHKDDWVI